jgi:uncharacterized protein (DUF2132 family)
MHGITLEAMVTELSERFGWAEMGRRIPVRCFILDPSVSSSLKFLRKPHGRVRKWRPGTAAN